ncbi:sialate O-acetylesterase [Flavobacterium endophyticum]|uniref:Sialate O-acetylesterase n=1 Tax=Flavobacterium endophyticum TaxID=1540163 RepID=A0A495M181_9FLAO|nr:sialate O-acetylesterase [Flavobacterium endophyticum]RKS19155.1 sialate O-acetylesterase [Flavobacterium endophyticum]
MKRILSLLFIAISTTLSAKATLPKFFSDHMVLQRDAPITIYGWADPGKTVKVSFKNQNLESKTNANGEWSLTFSSQAAGGPFEMVISEDNKITFKDVYIGDVWFCSGQSNMGWKLEDALNGKEELSNASHEKIKLLQVSRTMAGIPQKDIEKGQWETSSPESAEGFSAVAYFFGRELFQKYNVPIGLINSSWGGTNIEAWMSEDLMGKHTAAQKVIAEMKGINFQEVMKSYKKEFTAWEKKADELDLGTKEKWHNKDYNTSSWKTITLPVYWSKAKVTPNDGVIWVTRNFELTAKDLAKDELTLAIGRVDNEDITYINGIKVGESTQKDLDRFYKVPKSVLVAGKNVITIRVKNTGDIGGFRGDAQSLYIETASQRLSLAGEWKYEAGTKDIEEVPVRQHPTKYPTSLYNGMVAPFFGLKIKGIIWYQAEANSKNAKEYAGMFKDMITDWRKKWNADYPFIYAQLPNYANQNNRWITLRESQSKALELKNTGMAVLIDVGEDDNIHPIHKQIVGKRMALIASNVAYGEKDVPASAPVFDSFKIDGNSVTVTFKNGTFAPETAKANINGFMVAGSDKKFYPANAYLQSDMKTIKLSSDKVSSPKDVRYLWEDAPGKIMLYNKEGLATPPFRTDSF